MMSMGSLAHYMHDLSAQGFRIRDFLHEGNGDIWALALMKPRTVVRWIAIEEKAEGGDALYQEAQRHPRFLEGFDRVAQGGGVALYQRFDKVPLGSTRFDKVLRGSRTRNPEEPGQNLEEPGRTLR